MKPENKIQYLIVAEIENKGFLLRFMVDLKEAEMYAEKIFQYSDEFLFSDVCKIEEKLKYFASYKANGSEIYLRKIKGGRSNGAYTVSFMEVEMNKFCLKTFIRERENNSLVFDTPLNDSFFTTQNITKVK